MKKLISLAMLLTVILSACGAQTPATPTPDVLATANAAAATMIAQTQAAMPTATPIPPTNTPEPTPTLAPTLALPPTSSIPTLPPTQPPSAGTNCNGMMDVGASGRTTPVMFKNDTKYPITLTIGISSPNKFGQCGMISRALAKNGSTSVDVPYAYDGPCYWITAIIDPGGKNSKYVYGNSACINGDDKWDLIVTNDMVKVATP
jgi:hypothetical protein